MNNNMEFGLSHKEYKFSDIEKIMAVSFLPLNILLTDRTAHSVLYCSHKSLIVVYQLPVIRTLKIPQVTG